MIIKGIDCGVRRALAEAMVGGGGMWCKTEKERKEIIKWNKLKNHENKEVNSLYSKISGQLFDRTHKYFLKKWSFGNRENWANFLHKKCFFLFFYSFYVKITQILKVTHTIQNPPGRVFFLGGCSVLHEPLKTPTEHLYVYLACTVI